ncbi:hypothetical protein WA158_004964 [Blastocystis sp. Blastoise]
MDNFKAGKYFIPFDEFVENYKKYLNLIGEIDNYVGTLVKSTNLHEVNDYDTKSSKVIVIAPSLPVVSDTYSVISQLNEQKVKLSRILLLYVHKYIKSLDYSTDILRNELISYGIQPLSQFSTEYSSKHFLEWIDDENENQSCCICKRDPFGEMILCSNPKCPIEWFHYECVGLPPYAQIPLKWLCPICKKAMIEENK